MLSDTPESEVEEEHEEDEVEAAKLLASTAAKSLREADPVPMELPLPSKD